MDSRPFVAEFMGTFALIFIGAGTVALGVGGLLGAALSHGLVVMAFAWNHGRISGSYINPALTIGACIAGDIDSKKAISYVVAQLFGGIAGAFCLGFVLGGPESGLGRTEFAANILPSQAFAVEAILTFFLMYAVLASSDAKHCQPIAIGGTLVFCILMGGPLTGASLNPARTLGPAVATGQFAQIFVYILATTCGASLAALCHKHFIKS